jgi:hypothetical protein
MHANMFRGKRNVSTQVAMSRGFVPPKQPEIIISPLYINTWDLFTEWTQKMTEYSKQTLMDKFIYKLVDP